MSTKSLTNSPGLKGFSILQPFLGAPLAWMPAVGTKELDELVNAYVAGSGSIQEKRTAISIDFFEYSAQTGENFKYYPVTPTSAATTSPVTSFSASPAMSDLSYYGSSPSQASTPAPNMTRAASRQPGAANKAESTDFSHLPGMKILTIDGQDVTNSVSRGCKTKEQREHAHLMRVLKACDACKRKKIRCDPSHKRRASAQGKKTAEASTTTKPAAKKARKAKTPPTPATVSSQSAALAPTVITTAPEQSSDIDLSAFDGVSGVDQSWDEFLTFDNEAMYNYPVPEDFYGAVPQDFDFFFNGHDNQFSPAVSGSSGSFNSPAQPLTPVNSGISASHGSDLTFNDDQTVAVLGQEPTFPYLNPAGATYGSNYVDFNLFSPASSFVDEEPQKLKAGDKRKASALQSSSESPTSIQSPHNGVADTGKRNGLGEPLSAQGPAPDQQCYFDHPGSQSSTNLPQSPEWEVPGAQHQQAGLASTGSESALELSSFSNPIPLHALNATSATTHDLPLLQQAVGSRHLLPGEVPARAPGFSSQDTATIAPVSPPPSSQVVLGQRASVQQDIVLSSGGNAHDEQCSISSTDLLRLETIIRTPRQRASTLISASSSPAVSVVTISTGQTSRGDENAQGRQVLAAVQLPIAGLPSTGGLQPIGGLHYVPTSVAAANVPGLATPSALASDEVASIPVRAAGLRPEDERRHHPASSLPVLFAGDEAHSEGHARLAVTGFSSLSSASGPAGLCSYPKVISHGQAPRQALHGTAAAAADANAASSLSQRLLGKHESAVPTLPVRQLLGGRSSSSMMASTPLVVSGLVSVLLLLLMKLALASLAQNLQLQAPPIFAHLTCLTNSSFIVFSLLSLSAQHGVRSTSSAFDSVGSLFRRATSFRRCQPTSGRSAWSGVARVATACF